MSTACALGPGQPNARCGKSQSRLHGAVVAAIDLLVEQRPQLFDKTSQSAAGTGQFRVLDTEGYLSGVVANLVAAGYCSERDPDDARYERVLVKNDNGFSENFDVLTASGYIRRGGSYFETCSPASFPVDRGDLPAPGSGCGYPYPGPVVHMNCTIHMHVADTYTLDSTALVAGHDYCTLIGFTDRDTCPVRPETSPERVPCENWRLGNARDTGRPGPTWTTNGQYCTGRASGCANHPSNQHQLLVYKPGSYQVCANDGPCCTVEVP